ncbi:DUF3107 domain-containing protein [Demetria terragena]|uniref:DUF3107 domain-containing protein n=1 Tax=Demetria terragena TaxID=63959 RepID=UPI00035ED7AB|nr:DUF3107 domain-containing protein [Demetria terragena]
MQVKIGVQRVAREVVVDTELSTDEVTKAVSEALANNSPLVLADSHGQQVMVPAQAIAYVDIAGEPRGRVGFGG